MQVDLELLPDGGEELGVPVPDVVDPDAPGGVDVLPALHVGEERPFRFGDEERVQGADAAKNSPIAALRQMVCDGRRSSFRSGAQLGFLDWG